MLSIIKRTADQEVSNHMGAFLANSLPTVRIKGYAESTKAGMKPIRKNGIPNMVGNLGNR